METGVDIIAAERKRQIEKEGWSPEHDAQHTGGELARLASMYAIPNIFRSHSLLSCLFPRKWDIKWWKPSSRNRVRELAKAGALIAAEIDRLNAVEASEKLPDRQ